MLRKRSEQKGTNLFRGFTLIPVIWGQWSLSLKGFCWANKSNGLQYISERFVQYFCHASKLKRNVIALLKKKPYFNFLFCLRKKVFCSFRKLNVAISIF